jgi:Glycoside hydrolase family 44
MAAPRISLLAFAGLAWCGCGGGGTNSGPTSPAAPQASPTPVPGAPGAVRFTVDSQAGRVPISPYIYGTNINDWGGRSRGQRLGRLGGNRWTAYNWETNASNAGADFQHQNDAFLGGGETAGEAVRPHVARAFAAGASMVVTVPIAGYVSADKAPGGDVNRTPDWLTARFHESRPSKGSSFSYPPNVGDRVVYQDEFVAWLEAVVDARRDPARTIFYSLDNEPDLWASTHPRIRPTGAVTYAELVDRTTAFASAIKAVAPEALVFGPVSYGWAGFVRLQSAPDNGGRDFLDFYLAALREAESRARRRLVDVLDLHWYPEARGGGVRITEASGAADVAAARVQAPRSLWDPGYVETSWISQDAGVGAIRLLPRMREKIAAQYPGTRVAITEYNYGGGEHVSGAIAEADVLGIFGREQVFAGALWDLGGGGRFIDAAFAAYCNYDGALSRFGDTAVAAATSDVQASSVYASVDAARDDRMVVVAINKSTGPTSADLVISHPVELTRGQSFQITAATPAVVKGPSVAPTARNSFRLELPASSVTTVVLER